MNLKEVNEREQVYTTGAMLMLEKLEGIDLAELEAWCKEELFVIGAKHVELFLMRNKKKDVERIAKQLFPAELKEDD